MHVKDGYKLTELGEIPDDWEVKSFGNMFKLSSGSALTQREISLGKYPVYGGNGINGYHNQFMFETPQISIGRVGAKCGCVHVTEPRSWITDNALYISSKLLTYSDDYLVRQLENVNLNNYANHNAQPVISGTKIYPIQIPLPPLPEQQKIADILSTVDEHISETESLIEKTKVLKQGMMQQLLTKGIGHTAFKDTEIGRIPVEWEVVIMKSTVASTELGTNALASSCSPGYPLIKMGNLFQGGFDFSKIEYISTTEDEQNKKFFLQKGDFLFNTRNTPELVGKCAVWNCQIDHAVFNNNIMRIKYIKNIDSRYMAAYFSSVGWSQLKQIATGTTSVGAIYTKDLMKLVLQLPPLLEQQKIASIITSIDDQIDVYQTKLTSLTKIKSALMQQLLTGKTRVKI